MNLIRTFKLDETHSILIALREGEAGWEVDTYLSVERKDTNGSVQSDSPYRSVYRAGTPFRYPSADGSVLRKWLEGYEMPSAQAEFWIAYAKERGL